MNQSRMPMKKQIVLVGRGESMVVWHELHEQVDYGAISSSIILNIAPGWQQWFTVDHPFHYPSQWTLTVVPKHVPMELDGWMKYPNVNFWNYTLDTKPSFDVVDPIVQGPLGVNHSLLFAVQVCARLGYRTVYFAGCDLLSDELRPIADTLAEWYPMAREAGIEWFNCSGISALAEYIPNAETMYV